MEVNNYYGKKNTLSSLVNNIKPSLKVIIDIIIIFKCVIVSLSYYCLIYESLQTIFNETKSIDEKYTKLAAFGTATLSHTLSLAFIAAKNIRSLKNTSFLGIIGVLML